MSTNQRIDYIELPAQDFDAFQAFYTGVFGWTFTDYGLDYRAFSDGHLEGGIYRADHASLTANGAALVIIYAEDLEASRDRVLKCGGTICREVFAFPGGRRFQFKDPHGNELGVWSDNEQKQ